MMKNNKATEANFTHEQKEKFFKLAEDNGLSSEDLDNFFEFSDEKILLEFFSEVIGDTNYKKAEKEVRDLLNKKNPNSKNYINLPYFPEKYLNQITTMRNDIRDSKYIVVEKGVEYAFNDFTALPISIFKIFDEIVLILKKFSLDELKTIDFHFNSLTPSKDLSASQKITLSYDIKNDQLHISYSDIHEKINSEKKNLCYVKK